MAGAKTMSIQNNIEAKLKYRQFHVRAEKSLDELRELFNMVEKKGDKAKYCQHTDLRISLQHLEATIAGTVEADFMKD
jgi:hypothetical protein